MSDKGDNPDVGGGEGGENADKEWQKRYGNMKPKNNRLLGNKTKKYFDSGDWAMEKDKKNAEK